MKKLAVLVLAACTALSLVGCGSKELKNEYVTISEYKGVEIEKVAATEVTDEDVETEISSRLEQAATSTDVTGRAVQSGDIATIDYVGKKDGKEFDGGSSTDYPLEIGSGTFIDGFEDGIIGHNIGETFDLNLTFPESYGNADLAGQPVVFTVTVKSIQEKKVPELNDEFVKANSEESETVDEYKKEIKEELEKTNKETAESSMKEAAWTEVMDNTEVSKYPDEKLDKVKEEYRSQYEQMASYYGVEFDEFIAQYMGMDTETFEEQLDEAAKNSVKQQLAAELIAEKMKLTPTEKEYEEIFDEYTSTYGFSDVDTMKEQVGEDQLKEMAVQDKVLDWVYENAKQVESKDEEEDSSDDSSKDESKDSTDENTDSSENTKTE